MNDMARYRFAMYWAGACGGCDIAVLNLGPAILDFAQRFEIVFWPAAMDGKRRDVEAMPEASIDLALYCGSVRTSEDAHMAELMRSRSKVLVAFGSCATEGCIPGLANLISIDRMMSVVYDGPGAEGDDGRRPMTRWQGPDGVLELPTIEPRVRTLEQLVPVDYSVPGCPPETERIADVVALVTAALDGKVPLPPRGSVLGAGHSTVCDECGRTRGLKHITAFERIQTLAHVDPALCLLEQGLPCNGPATRDGCGAKCPAAGAPCIGCYGATDGVIDVGSRLLSAFASVVDASEPEDIDRILDGLPDTVGQFYRFSLAASLMHGGRS